MYHVVGCVKVPTMIATLAKKEICHCWHSCHYDFAIMILLNDKDLDS